MPTLDPAGWPPVLPVGNELVARSEAIGQSDFAIWLGQEEVKCLPSEPATQATEWWPRLEPASIRQTTDKDATGVLYGWQLLSQTSLSQLDEQSHSGGGVQSPEAPSARLISPGQGWRTAPVEPGNASCPADDGEAATMRPLSPASSVAVESAQTGETDGRSSSATRTSLAALPIWTERSMRRVEGADGKATVWLRDYRLSNEELATTVDEIVAFYGESNSVTRVVINGNEVWRKPAHPAEKQ